MCGYDNGGGCGFEDWEQSGDDEEPEDLAYYKLGEQT